MLLELTRVSLLNGISFRPTALAGCTNVTDDTQTDRRTEGPRGDTSVVIGGIADAFSSKIRRGFSCFNFGYL